MSSRLTAIDDLRLLSSSDSDSDPEGGELPDIGYSKDSKLSKKKSKKHRVDKSLEERVQKANNKREVNVDVPRWTSVDLLVADGESQSTPSATWIVVHQ